MNNLKRSDIMTKLNENPNQIFGMIYFKDNGEKRAATGRLHVVNPKYGTKPGQGIRKGISDEEALKNYNNMKYYDCGKKGYRTAHIEKIQQMVINHTKYTVID